jgi:hypothetical protein
VSDNREAWLGKAAQQLADRILYSEDVPPLRISVGWPGGGSRKTRVGECWSTSSAADGINQIYLSPIRGESDTQDVLGTLLHEMIHAVNDCEDGHRGEFARIAKAVGFEAPLTSADNRSEELSVRLDEIAEIVGQFPHAEIMSGTAADTPPKQNARQLKIQCPEDGYIARTTRKWLDELGVPTCPCGTPMEEAA